MIEATAAHREANAAVQPVARQIVAALVPPPASGGVAVTTARGVTEIALSPEELGRVQISVLGQDKPLIVIMAERPETLELLRRNADLLGTELREAGLEGGALSFRDGPPPEPQRLLRETTQEGSVETGIPVIPLAIAQEAGRLAAQRRIDIRL
ncbi:flagellar hook-length control protein FliK [Paracoccus sp. NSM]|uniref:flagellar hook-length control protein FliK n=1 Tax=Paracoccus sp. NSM TaxID=3457784 RepID=UPI004035E97B